jgi:hypothetical protein
MERAPRWKSWVSSSSSRRRIKSDTAGWLRPNSAAAAVKVPHRTVVTNASSWLRVVVRTRLLESGHEVMPWTRLYHLFLMAGDSYLGLDDPVLED